MTNKRNLKILQIASLVIIGLLFCYFRLKPIYYQNVAYTYDQGRDFMKAAEMVINKDPTFIGPTTGINGIFHGAWWYYVLTIPFILFQGLPIGYYIFIFLIQLLCFIVLLYFVKKYFNGALMLIIAILVSVSPYFIQTSFFAGNNIMVLPALLLFLIVNFLLIEKYPKSGKKSSLLVLLLGLSLGLVAEFEFAFGLMLLPLYALLMIILPDLRKRLLTKKNFIIFMAALAFIFIPRLLFELKNNFSQTRTLTHFIFEPKLYNPKPYSDIVIDRLKLFQNYYQSIFPNMPLLLITTAGALIPIFFLVKKKSKLQYKNSLIFFSLLTLGLLIFSTILKDNFWANYYEGLPYIYIFILLILFYSIKKQYIYVVIFITFVVSSAYLFVNSLDDSISMDGLKKQTAVVDYVIANADVHNGYCVKVYTPPVIPHTYNYLFKYQNISKDIPLAQPDWQHNECWIIIESDNYVERQQNWIKDNIPQEVNLVKDHNIDDISIQHWFYNKEE